MSGGRDNAGPTGPCGPSRTYVPTGTAVWRPTTGPIGPQSHGHVQVPWAGANGPVGPTGPFGPGAIVQEFCFLRSGEMVVKGQEDRRPVAWTMTQIESHLVLEFQSGNGVKKIVGILPKEMFGDVYETIMEKYRSTHFPTSREEYDADVDMWKRVTQDLAAHGWTTVWPVMVS